jgi:hypothetical protein
MSASWQLLNANGKDVNMLIKAISPERADVKVQCCQCGEWIITIASECFVDYDGTPWTYYCKKCLGAPIDCTCDCNCHH